MELKQQITKTEDGYLTYLSEVNNFLFNQGKKAGIKKECRKCNNEVVEGTTLCERDSI